MGGVGWYRPGVEGVQPGRAAVVRALQRLDTPFAVVGSASGPAVGVGGRALLGHPEAVEDALPLLAWVPALTPDRLGDAAFRSTYGVRVAYIAGAMANGIGSPAIVVAMARAGMLGMFGAAGLPTARIADAVERIREGVGGLPWGANLIHSPQDPRQEQETVDLYLEQGVRVVSASAYVALTPMVVQYRTTGLRQGPQGEVAVPRRLLAKVSRPEVAERFLRPPPESLLERLVHSQKITEEEARLARRIPMADDLIAEADSGGHTDNRPLAVLLPLLVELRDRIVAEHGYPRPVRVGAAGGLGTPHAVAAAFALGAAFVLTGTVNQACLEAGTSPMVKRMLAEAGMADVGMAPASDMFEGGVEVQVLQRGTLFAVRARQLRELYLAHESLDQLSSDQVRRLESTVFRRSLDEVWSECVRFFEERDPGQLDRTRTDARHKMALVFRWYLGLSSRWGIEGDERRRTDSQVWCGPAIGAFNAWTRGTYLARPENRRVVDVAANLMAGAAALTRARWLQNQGVEPGPQALQWVPREVSRAV